MVAFFAVTFTSCSSFMLAVLSVDCYLGLRRDVSAGSMRNACTVNVVVWLLAGTLNCIIPYVRVQQLVKFYCSDLEFAYCVEKWPHDIDWQAYSVIVLIVKYVVPTLIISVSYALVVPTLVMSLKRTASLRN
ncbi:hypothetical protein LSAT2_026652 [Lamellibrachia satsuma]|nr:hypothetical protein LSAT2_026652 [Lamellibrachia satsuma]